MTILQTSVLVLESLAVGQRFTTAEFWQQAQRQNCSTTYTIRHAHNFLGIQYVIGNVGIVAITSFGDYTWERIV
mgnify:CR=1 FL=1